ncbi:MAG: SDR family oxidoreductase [Actinomycetota bacterium]|nr:SDR family oxidoreductase [Actinomycetota bacterium]
MSHRELPSGSAAVVTGASSGIGEQFCRLLAARGVDLVLVARNKQRLNDLAEELSGRHKITTEVCSADLSSDDDVAMVARRIRDGGDIDLVVNNAGIGWYGQFADEPPTQIESMLGVNVMALTMLSRAALATMVPRRHGGLLNVSSTASAVPGPRSAVYHAAKAYVTSLTEALHEEARPHGVHVTALCPGVTPTGFQQSAGCSRRALGALPHSDPAEVAAAGLRALGRNQAVCVPGLLNQLSLIAARLGPRAAVRWGSRRVLAAA